MPAPSVKLKGIQPNPPQGAGQRSEVDLCEIDTEGPVGIDIDNYEPYDVKTNTIRVVAPDGAKHRLQLTEGGIYQTLRKKHDALMILWMHSPDVSPPTDKNEISEGFAVPVPKQGFVKDIGPGQWLSEAEGQTTLQTGAHAKPKNQKVLREGNAIVSVGDDNGESVTIQTEENQIVMGKDSMLKTGKEVENSWMGNVSKAGIMKENPLGFLPSLFFLPMPQWIPDLSLFSKAGQLMNIANDIVNLTKEK